MSLSLRVPADSMLHCKSVRSRFVIFLFKMHKIQDMLLEYGLLGSVYDFKKRGVFFVLFFVFFLVVLF